MLGGAETDHNQQKELRQAVRRVLASAAMADQDDPAANRTLLNALDSLAGKLKALPGVEDSDTEDITADVQYALKAARNLSAEDLARFLHGLGDLAEGSAAKGGSLEDLAGWLDAHFGPILSRHMGLNAEADRKQQIKDAISKQINSSLTEQGFTPRGTAPAQPASGTFTRHHLFWQNFSALAPGLAPLLTQPGGADAAATQISAILASLDLPSGVTVMGDQGGATLDFTASADPTEAQMLVRILSDAPAVPGWTISVGGHIP